MPRIKTASPTRLMAANVGSLLSMSIMRETMIGRAAPIAAITTTSVMTSVRRLLCDLK
ncbi:MAG: hypothetical protein U0V48_10600 [Anaerolineales bacterium]